MSSELKVPDEGQRVQIVDEIRRLADEVDRLTRERMRQFEKEASSFANEQTVRTNPLLKKVVSG